MRVSLKISLIAFTLKHSHSLYMFRNFYIALKEETASSFSFTCIFSQSARRMISLTALLLILVVMLDGQTLPQSYIGLSDLGERFQPANSIELLEMRSVSSLLQCGYGKISSLIRS
jgi:hypothetical protein